MTENKHDKLGSNDRVSWFYWIKSLGKKRISMKRNTRKYKKRKRG